ncbi:hypothetical protein CTEN210_16857 [Chaetoceros tenuissimus]|uniref:Uncharacterized protein n=1 Tax=Chaetoceros tenuissimus TaxID=426638 RepID=A0AAD3DBS6_9STRA|nr:hypothetical protein CTEN210_16857 [Chaetoceros tenuissimus]
MIRSCEKDNRKKQRLLPDLLEKITIQIDPSTHQISYDDFKVVFDKYKIVYFPQINTAEHDGSMKIEEFFNIFNKLTKEDKETWTEETWDIKKDEVQNRIPGTFLEEKDSNRTQRGYCSFIVQHDDEQKKEMLKKLPVPELPFAQSESDEVEVEVEYGPGIWIFYGRNNENKALEGRGEHTDSIEHDGTFHFQISGVKNWHVRPTSTLLNLISSESESDDCLLTQKWIEELEKDDCVKHSTLDIECSKGDILMINTKLWWHATDLPQQPFLNESKAFVPSVSYARDVYLDKTKIGKDHGTNLTNLDGLYAADDIEAGTIVFRESEMPGCELHRTRENPNCEIVELSDGEGAIVSCREIKAGEFFCVLESDDSSCEEEYETDDDEEQ